jgi:hypothetical protein
MNTQHVPLRQNAEGKRRGRRLKVKGALFGKGLKKGGIKKHKSKLKVKI